MSPMKTSESIRLPSLLRKDGRGFSSQSSSISSLSDFSHTSPGDGPVSVSPIKKKQQKKRINLNQHNSKEFKGLVALINLASKSGGSSVGAAAPGTVAVLDKWEELSKV